LFVSFACCRACAEPFKRALKLHEFQASAFLKGTQDMREILSSMRREIL
jgi:hypothetical protein